MTKRILGILAAILLAASALTGASAQVAQAITSTPMTCYYRADNTLLNPTWKVHCYNTSRTYRAKAWCQILWAYGPWKSGGVASQAQCFLVNVDTVKSTIQFQ